MKQKHVETRQNNIEITKQHNGNTMQANWKQKRNKPDTNNKHDTNT